MEFSESKKASRNDLVEHIFEDLVCFMGVTALR